MLPLKPHRPLPKSPSAPERSASYRPTPPTPIPPNKSSPYPTTPNPFPPPPSEVEVAIRHLRNADPLLAPLIDLHQRPTFDTFQTPFLALTRSILYQQLAYKAGNSIYTRFVGLCGGEACVVPETVLAQTPQQLRQIGVSGRKASYLHDLARKYQNGILSDAAIVNMDDKSLFTMLTMVNGIGSWSVHMFMIFSLHRPDVLPINDLSMRKGVQLLYNLDELPRPSQMEHLCEKWRPYRSVAACYMWRFSESKGAPSVRRPWRLVRLYRHSSSRRSSNNSIRSTLSNSSLWIHSAVLLILGINFNPFHLNSIIGLWAIPLSIRL
ncbi:putative DNA-3-methyladenine glycosylase 2 isoform X4 [Prunus yedoensis var. nudiflora]|uniref:Putative DNA-3-methyladenine glycosylase 2 isoform X4 n=1 Tax=Prunus yedoensis var. nudiflora TaxID=2094558 RepID=A0A314XPT0_PRUYE|nr:putative DNA-3-methyladenine glycosylase 2 isoform X4 [Prunus yedoensis var. nudiflora]